MADAPAPRRDGDDRVSPTPTPAPEAAKEGTEAIDAAAPLAGRPEPAHGTSLPTRLSELEEWVDNALQLSPAQGAALIARVAAVLARERQQWEQSKADTIRSLVDDFAARIEGLKQQLSERDATVSAISRHFEQVVAELTRRANRDPKTQLMNFTTFLEQLEIYLAVEQRGQWCAVGLVDVTSFKWFNDSLGHPVGDVIIERIAQLLQQHVRSHDLVAQSVRPDLHARFGGDEFCFLIPNLDQAQAATVIANRFRAAVQRHDWAAEHKGLEQRPVSVDIGVACFQLGPVPQRRHNAAQLARELLAYADRMMYAAKNDRSESAYVVPLRLQDGQVVAIDAVAGIR